MNGSLVLESLIRLSKLKLNNPCSISYVFVSLGLDFCFLVR